MKPPRSARPKMARSAMLSLTLFGLPLAALASEQPDAEIAVATAAGQRLLVQEPGGACSLNKAAVLRQIGVDASISAIPALVTYAKGPRKIIRVLLVDRQCKFVQSFEPYGILLTDWPAKLAEATRLGFLDLSDQRRNIRDPAWGSWNLRTGSWEVTPCCSPAHSVIQADEHRRLQSMLPLSVPQALVQVALLPVVKWTYVAAVLTCGLIAFSRGRRELSLVLQSVFVLPIKAVVFSIVIATIASLAVLAAIVGSGGMGLFAGEVRNRMRASWRR